MQLLSGIILVINSPQTENVSAKESCSPLKVCYMQFPRKQLDFITFAGSSLRTTPCNQSRVHQSIVIAMHVKQQG